MQRWKDIEGCIVVGRFENCIVVECIDTVGRCRLFEERRFGDYPGTRLDQQRASDLVVF